MATQPPPRAVLLDSGGVLVRPIGGRWNPRADFEETVTRHAPWLTVERLAEAVTVGDRFLAAQDRTPDRDAYHAAMLRHLGVAPGPELLAELDRAVPPAAVLEPFPEVLATLTALRARGVPMAVVSDAWPELRDLHAGLGLRTFFEVYAISAELGCEKPDPRMYAHASEGLGLAPQECLFVDDRPELVAAALALGYRGLALVRHGTLPGGVPAIRALDELLPLFAERPAGA
ncbi:HAD-IA family hydrolase [Streptomyces sp. DSM 44915]|uniref:HAD-IA family hydrolase n=1 Tax=Streptomyces chisholmiae TaxID=3075540 RepID=A0ABU2JKB3_9ACTN|nr:HAD-IA family hydrolase [Streptomyces sp. DSM 44915]MDT0265134.1 HAD-IA family hydrolase [Streptomyces sp. DSM 44915]